MVITVYLIFMKITFSHCLTFSLWYFLSYHFKTFRYVRMSPEQFECLLKLVRPTIQKNITIFCACISPEVALVLTLRFFASGNAQQSIACSFRIGKITLSNIIRETCNAIYDCQKDTYLSKPKSEEDWLRIALQFIEKWNMPHVIGVIDGKHIRMESPKLSGSQYFNSKGFFSMVLLGICDASYWFVLFDLGQYMSKNSSRALLNLLMCQIFEENHLKVPKSGPRENVGNLQVYLTCHHIFPLKTLIMWPYPGWLMKKSKFTIAI